MVLNIPKQTYNRAVISASGNIIFLEGDIDHSNPEVFIKPFFDKVLSHTRIINNRHKKPGICEFSRDKMPARFHKSQTPGYQDYH